jgi:alginate O-acetyltransferase complex protein AlgI
VVFSSATFLFFFLPCVLALYYLSPMRLRNGLLLLASLVFYAWGEPVYVFLMLGSITVNWVVGLLMARYADTRREKQILALGILFDLVVLAYFKYAGFLVAGILAHVPGLAHLASEFHAPRLPIGISFFTFHAMSYLVDIYRRQARALRNPLNMGVYITMFPQLIAGPIIRFHDVAEQILKRSNTLPRFASGVERFSYGLGKKMLIANPMGAVADWAFGLDTAQLHTGDAWVGIVAYSLQIYFDFAGYSDMAIGLGRMFGFEFLENFNYPYVASTMQEFWRRWHLSLSAWFRDYLYIPLGGNRKGDGRTAFNLFTVFILCGFWHGAGWTFIFWGFWHGLFLALERGRWGRMLGMWPTAVRWLYTMAVVLIGWVFFRAESFTHAWQYLVAMTGLEGQPATGTALAIKFASIDRWTMLVALVLSTPVFAFMARDYVQRGYPIKVPRGAIYQWAIGAGTRIGETRLPALRIVAVVAILLVCATYVAAGTYNPFIYYRF